MIFPAAAFRDWIAIDGNSARFCVPNPGDANGQSHASTRLERFHRRGFLFFQIFLLKLKPMSVYYLSYFSLPSLRVSK